MASKIVKKKSSAKATAKASVSTAASPASAKASVFSAKPKAAPKLTSVLPFNPLDGMTNSNILNLNQSMPSFEGFETMETTMNNFKNQYEKMSGDASSSVRESVENLTKSSATFTKGAEQMMKTLSEVVQESAQRNAEAMKSMMAVRTLNEFAEAQNKLAQQNFDDMMSVMTKMSEMTIKLCTEAFEPINSQMTKTMNSAMSAAGKKNAA